MFTEFPESEPKSPAQVLPAVRAQHTSARDAPVLFSDPHDPIIISQSRPSSRGVRSLSNLTTSELRGSGTGTCGRSWTWEAVYIHVFASLCQSLALKVTLDALGYGGRSVWGCCTANHRGRVIEKSIMAILMCQT